MLKDNCTLKTIHKLHVFLYLGRHNTEIWTLNCVFRGPGRLCWTHIIPNGKALTLLPIIKNHIKPGTAIMTDCAKAYDKLEDIKNSYYIHRRVKHKTNYVHPEDRRVYTQVRMRTIHM